MDRENLELIVVRIENVKAEINEMKQGMQDQAQESEQAQQKEKDIADDDDILNEMLGDDKPPPQDHMGIRRKTTKLMIEEEAQRVDADIDDSTYEMIVARMRKYSLAANYCNKILGDKKLTMQHLSTAESLKDISNAYKKYGKVDEDNLPEELTPNLLFGMTNEERHAKFDKPI